ncbi:HTTM domain-containing protein [Isosphaeraceae bacterium EP7]
MNPLRAWNRFWFAPVSARPLGLFRIAFGMLALANLALLATDMTHWFTSAGLVRGVDAPGVAGSLRYSLLQTWQSPAVVGIVFGAQALALVLLLVGWHTRLVSVAVYLLQLTLHHRNIASANDADILLIATSFALMFSPSGAAFSLDALRAARRRGTAAEPLIEPWGQRLIQIQLVLAYAMVAFYRGRGINWFDGSAVHFLLNNPELGRFRLDPLSMQPMVINALTFAAVALGGALPFLLWFKSTRSWMIAGGLTLHVGAMLVMNIPLFNELCMATYLLFMTPEELAAVARPFRSLVSARERKAAVRAEFAGRVDGPHIGIASHRPERVGSDRVVTLAETR